MKQTNGVTRGMATGFFGVAAIDAALPAVSSLYGLSQAGYNGLGNGKDWQTAALQAAVGTIAGSVTRGLDIGIDKMKIRLAHVSNLQGDGSPLATLLQSMIRQFEIRAAKISVVP